MIPQPEVRLHLSNVSGAGATQLLDSLLPALQRNRMARIVEIYLPDRGALANYRAAGPGVQGTRYRRWLPKALSRLLECTLLSWQFNGSTPILVLGDLPLRCNASQTVFVQTPHLSSPSAKRWTLPALNFAISRWVFRINARFVAAYIVQTSVMRDALAQAYPFIEERIHVVAQPVPAWLLHASVHRRGRDAAGQEKLSLIYPAALYPHKNHRLLGEIEQRSAHAWPIDHLTLTIPQDQTPAPRVPWVQCCGFLPPHQMIDLYRRADGLLFLSTHESYGFPLVEAMFVGIPIVCPDLPYARALCGDGAIYFEAQSVNSLRTAIETLHKRLATGWWPNWSDALRRFPANWDEVASAMLAVTVAPKSNS